MLSVYFCWGAVLFCILVSEKNQLCMWINNEWFVIKPVLLIWAGFVKDFPCCVFAPRQIGTRSWINFFAIMKMISKSLVQMSQGYSSLTFELYKNIIRSILKRLKEDFQVFPKSFYSIWVFEFEARTKYRWWQEIKSSGLLLLVERPLGVASLFFHLRKIFFPQQDFFCLENLFH